MRILDNRVVRLFPCALCMMSFESSYHLFLSCPFDLHLWKWLARDILLCVIDTPTIFSTLSCIPLRQSSQIRDMVIASIFHMFHTIGLIRNGVRFHNAIVTLHATKDKIYTMMAMSGTNSKGLCLPIVSDIRLLDNFMVSPGFRVSSKSR